MYPETSLLDNHVGPDTLEQLFAAEDFPGVLHQYDEDIQRPAANPDRFPASCEQSLRDAQAKWAERRNHVMRNVLIEHGGLR
ncbi:Putative lipoprotein [Mesorhizobium loti]|nr:Putative lipoprotein [Mesorhizobium loti]